MKAAARQYARNHWPDTVVLEFNDFQGVAFINIIDDEKVLTVDQAIGFYDYLYGLFPDLIRWE